MQKRSEDGDFADYNAAQAGRPVRPLARRAVENVPRESGVAVELGSGIGVEACFLAESGFHVHTFDADPSVGPNMRQIACDSPADHTTVALEDIDALPESDLLLSCATLAFVRCDAFEQLWEAIRDSLVPRTGVLAADLFGDHDDWAGTDGTFLPRREVEELLGDWDVLDLEESERDGRSFSGPKHWHTIQVIARAPERQS